MLHCEMIHDIYLLLRLCCFFVMLQFIRARKAVVSNASMWDTLSLLPPEAVPKSYQDGIETTQQCESFMHLHLGFDAEVRHSTMMHCNSFRGQ